ncbi:LOW QUALITY PROTEIN: hypothetical protein Cgig2_020489 [Carnegiea gigantea]|uniref:Aminotransferase-like plant mobile domain-containing protein n=1 Tax=Carnegiea gigantea TaxID=171969 RepID=A0A9Q1KCW2_9CARY|nr:LOW QUALITY PROTEIN: hypothetical protein Cgig2_020489 [Carnegiea gigantea]
MTVDGTCGSQKAPNKNGHECDFGLDYQRSISLRDLEVDVPSDSKVFKTSWFKKDRIWEGTLEYLRNEEHGSINVCKTQENCFNATVLEKVNTDGGGEEKYLFHGCETYKPSIMEWVGQILTKFEETLEQAGIFGTMGVSQFRYHFNCVVWRAFCKLWGPLTNTLHHGHGEIDISLYNLKRISRLPLSGDVYKEFLPRNDILCDPTKRELTLTTREYDNVDNVECYEGRKTCCLYSFLAKPFCSTSWQKYRTIENICDGCTTSKGSQIFFSSHASHPGHPSEVGATLPIHYVMGWLAELFPRLYSRRPDLRHIFRDEQFAYLRASTFPEDSQTDFLASREWGFQSLSTLRSMIDIYKLSTIEICWLSSKIEEIFEIVASVTQIEESVNILSDRDLTCSSKIVHIEGQLNNLSNKSSKLRLKEPKILKEAERICKMQEDLTCSLIEAERELKSSLDLKKKEAEQVKVDLAGARFLKLQDLEKEKDHLKNLIGFVISFNNVLLVF